MPESSPVLIGVIFVLYHDYDSFETLLQSQEDLPPNMHIVVVDNSEPEFVHPQRLENLKKDMHIEVISAPDNPGYFGAANRAMGLSSRLRASKWVCVSNVDLAIDLASVYEVLQDFDVPTDLAIGALAPMVRDCSGAPMKQPHELRRPSEQNYRRLAAIYRWYWLAVAHRLLSDFSHAISSRQSSSGLEPGQPLFAPHGAFMILSQRYLETTAAFGYSSFLFCEEIHVGLECLDAGLFCFYEPRISYRHSRHGSIGRIPSRRTITNLADAHRAMAARLGDAETHHGKL